MTSVTRRRFLVQCIAGLAVPGLTNAQPVQDVRRVGRLATDTFRPALRAEFLESLRNLGWEEGKNLLVVDRGAHGRIGDLPRLASELVEMGVDVIVAYNNQAILAAKQATARIPIVMGSGINPVGDGLIVSLARPGGNVTGLTWDPDPQITEKYLEILREIVPRLALVAGLIDPTYPQIGVYRRAAEMAASRLGLALRHQEVRAEDDLPGAFARMR
jgi:ABC-type uncharacterized transport system substrate-binding protein